MIIGIHILQLKKKSKKILFLIVQYKNFVFLERNQLKKIWKGLYYFPTFEKILEILKWIQNKNIYIYEKKICQSFIHKFSHIQLFCTPIRVQIHKKFLIKKNDNNIWLNIANPQKVGIPSPIKKIINNELYHTCVKKI